jgi:cell division protein FtsB
MIVLHEMRRRARLLVGPVFGIAATGYFVYHTFEGDRGLRAGRDITQQLYQAKQTLAATEVDEQIRSTLDLVGPNEIIILHPGDAH